MTAVSREREGLEGSFPSRSPDTDRLRRGVYALADQEQAG